MSHRIRFRMGHRRPETPLGEPTALLYYWASPTSKERKERKEKKEMEVGGRKKV